MTTLEERQSELEWSCVCLGMERYQEQLSSQGESASLPGQHQTAKLVPVLAQVIDEWKEKAAVTAGRYHSALQYLVHTDSQQAAYLTIRYALDAAAQGMRLNTAALSVGRAIRDHLDLVNMLEDAPPLYRKVMEQVKKATSASHRAGVLRHVSKKFKLRSLKWTDANMLLMGTKLIELLEECSELIEQVRQTTGASDTPIFIKLTEKAEQWFKEGHAKTAVFQPVHLPMLVPPRDWVSPTKGGYLTRVIRGAKMVTTYSKGHLDELANIEMPAVYNAVNSVQRTPWRINKQLLALIEEARSSGPRFKELVEPMNDPIPVRPAIPEKGELSEEQTELLRAWKMRAAKTHEANAKRASERHSVAHKISIARQFVNEEAIYFPHYLDFRGRIYPFANHLNPQGDDIAKALLEFAEGHPLGESGAYWLKVHIANLFGVDKLSFAERVKWVNDNTEKLLDSALRPFDGMQFWMTADKGDNKWCALAACIEFAGYCLQGEEYVSHLPIAMDGSCSGLQHYSAMLRDPVGGAAVNLVPADRPGDIYTQVANKGQVLSDNCTNALSAVWKNKVVRKIAKQPTMTLCYSATVYGMRQQIASAVAGMSTPSAPYLGQDVDVQEASAYMADIIWNAIGETVIAARSAMDFLKKLAKLAASAGLPIYWTAPSGFLVSQAYRQVKSQRVKVHYKGLRMELSLAIDGTAIDKKRQAAGVAPNFVHACDSSHLMGTVNLGVEQGLTSWACIHDSFGVHAAHVETLHACIRESFIEQYTPNVLAKFRDEIVEQLAACAPELLDEVPDLPPLGTLDLQAVRDAGYFFA